MAFALSLCNITSKFKTSSDSNSNAGPGSTSSGTSGDATVEHAQPNAAQTAALAGGQTVTWEKQGISWTLPPKWTKATDETQTFVWRSPGGADAANLIVSISPMDEKFPTEVSLKAYYDSSQSRAKNGEIDEVRWLEIDGVKGVQFREAAPEKQDNVRRLQWIAYRDLAGQKQMINLMLATDGKDFPRHQDALYAILYSTKIVR
ncbi:MAG: hypothetical protein QOD00_2400 [Blastocatellia bacterium]|nr:hypothetical protein [Blastocatellia bacterium]